MAVKLPNGSLFYIASGYGTPATITAISNASPAVASATAHGFSNGDYVEITSGWSRLNNKIVRVANITTDTFELEGINTTSTIAYAAGAGGGSARDVTGWTQLQQILTTSTSGGEQQFATYQFVEDDQETRIPTTKSAAGLDLSIADDPTLAGYQLASTANDDRDRRAIKCILANSSIITYNAYVSLDKTPSMTANEVMACKATLSFLNSDPVRYTA
jgi:hypothetical protein